MSVETFTYVPGVELRTARDGDGELIVCLADLAHGLGIQHVATVRKRLPEGVVRNHTLQTAGGPQSMVFVTEAGMNMVIWRSDKPEAVAYARWCAERITELRRHGLTATPATAEAILNDPDVMIAVLTELKTERAKRAQLEVRAAADAPKVLFADAVAASNSTILIGDLAKLLRQNGIAIGGTRLFACLRSDGYLIGRRGTDWNSPTQYAMELGLFTVKETAITHSDGHVSISKTTKVTGRGQQYFIERFLDGRLPKTTTEGVAS